MVITAFLGICRECTRTECWKPHRIQNMKDTLVGTKSC